MSAGFAGQGTGLNLLRPSRLRTLLVLGRVSNLPTVWSNCLAGWWLGGGGRWAGLFWVSMSATFFYLGGMFLNDAFDAQFDRNNRNTRPIPSGAISEGEVWLWGIGWMVLGMVCIVWMGVGTALLALALAASILVYDAIHKIVVLAPILMGLCRVLLYLVSASAGLNGVTGEAIWKGLALGCYIVGLSFLARKESTGIRMQYWPCCFLAAPVGLAWLIDDASDERTAFLCSLILILWAVWILAQTFGRAQPNVGRVVSHLLAGIVLVDFLAVADWSHWAAALFVAWFSLALWLQNFIPAT